MHFSNTFFCKHFIFDNIYQTETLRSLKIGYSSGQGLLPTSVVTRSSFIQFLRSSSPNNKVISKCLVFFEVSGSTVAVQSPKSGYSSAETSYFDFELLFLAASATQVEIESHNCFCTVFYGASMDKDD